MKAIALVAVFAAFTTSVVSSFGQANRPLTEWEIRTSTSLEAQAERGRRQAAQREALARARAGQKQAQEDARDPERAAVRRAQAAFNAAKTLPEKELAYLNLKAAYDLWAAKIDLMQRQSAARAADAAAQDLDTIQWLLQQQANRLQQIQHELARQRQP